MLQSTEIATATSSFFPVLPKIYTFLHSSSFFSIYCSTSPNTSSMPLLFFLLSKRMNDLPFENSFSTSLQQINLELFSKVVSKYLLSASSEVTGCFYNFSFQNLNLQFEKDPINMAQIPI